VIPRALAENAGLNIISQLYASHEKGNIKDGVDIEVSVVVVVVVWIWKLIINRLNNQNGGIECQ